MTHRVGHHRSQTSALKKDVIDLRSSDSSVLFEHVTLNMAQCDTVSHITCSKSEIIRLHFVESDF